MPSMYVIFFKSESLGDESTYDFFPKYDEDIGRASGSTEIREDLVS
jgi:hypothetical protein